MSHTEARLTTENRTLRRRQTSRTGSLAARSPSPGRRSHSDSPNSLPRPPKARIWKFSPQWKFSWQIIIFENYNFFFIPLKWMHSTPSRTKITSFHLWISEHVASSKILRFIEFCCCCRFFYLFQKFWCLLFRVLKFKFERRKWILLDPLGVSFEGEKSLIGKPVHNSQMLLRFHLDPRNQNRTVNLFCLIWWVNRLFYSCLRILSDTVGRWYGSETGPL